MNYTSVLDLLPHWWVAVLFVQVQPAWRMTPPELDPVLVEGSSRFAQVVDHRMRYPAIFWVPGFEWISFVQQEDGMYFAHLVMGDNDVDESRIPLRFLQVVAWVAFN